MRRAKIEVSAAAPPGAMRLGASKPAVHYNAESDDTIPE
jgi:hypothetical protein